MSIQFLSTAAVTITISDGTISLEVDLSDLTYDMSPINEEAMSLDWPTTEGLIAEINEAIKVASINGHHHLTRTHPNCDAFQPGDLVEVVVGHRDLPPVGTVLRVNSRTQQGLALMDLETNQLVQNWRRRIGTFHARHFLLAK